MKQKFGDAFQIVQSRIHLLHLPQSAIEELKRFFAIYKTHAMLDSKVFANVSIVVSTYIKQLLSCSNSLHHLKRDKF